MKYRRALLLVLAWSSAHAAAYGISVQPRAEPVMTVNMQINQQSFEVQLFDNPTAKALLNGLPLQVEMTELNGNEKFVDLPQALPSNPQRPGNIHAGDLMLYGSNTLVLFYHSFSSPYRYTPIGKVIDPHALATAVGRHSVAVAFSARQGLR